MWVAVVGQNGISYFSVNSGYQTVFGLSMEDQLER